VRQGSMCNFEFMKTTTTLDAERRAVLPPTFQPYDVVEEELSGAASVTYQRAADSIPLVSSRDWRGKKMGARIALSRELIASAVRADRDAR